MKKSTIFHQQLGSLIVFLIFTVMLVSCDRNIPIGTEQTVFCDYGLLVNISNFDNADYKTLSIYAVDHGYKKLMFHYHEDRITFPYDSCFKINENEYSQKRRRGYNLDKEYISFYDYEHPFLIVHLFNINEEVTFRKDKYFVFEFIGEGEDSLKLVKSFVGKRLSYEPLDDDNGFAGFIFSTNNSFIEGFSWAYQPELSLQLPDIKFYLNTNDNTIEDIK